MSGKCPSCGNPVTSVRIEGVSAGEAFGNKWKGITYVCPNVSCQAVLGVSIDPIAIKTDIVNDVVKALKKGY